MLNRYSMPTSPYRSELNGITEDSIVVVTGEYNKQYQKSLCSEGEGNVGGCVWYIQERMTNSLSHKVSEGL